MTLDPLQQRVQQVGVRFVLGYLRQKDRADKILEEAESLEYREELAKRNPELAKLLEWNTREEPERREELWCLSVGVAHAILYALGETT